jgi:hypothetical protein
MKINFAQPILDFEGNPVLGPNETPLLISKELANGLVRMNDKENPLKIWELSKKIFASTEAIDLDTSDLDLLKNKVKSSDQFTVGFSGQVLEILSK